VAECFFKYLKLEQTNRFNYQSVKDLELSIFEYINYYNTKRIHSTLNYLTPNEAELKFSLSLLAGRENTTINIQQN